MICDKASALYNSAYAMGCAVALVLGGALKEQGGFRFTTDSMAVSCTILFIVYLAIVVFFYKRQSAEA